MRCSFVTESHVCGHIDILLPCSVTNTKVFETLNPLNSRVNPKTSADKVVLDKLFQKIVFPVRKR
jgi:hypothetical protein